MSTGSLGQEQYGFPTTVAQKALWYLDQLEPGNPAWNIAVRFRIEGPLRTEQLEEALNRIAERHEILRTSFSLMEDQPTQIIHASAVIPLPVDDLRRLSSVERDAEEERQTLQEASRGFDLEAGPLFRARVLRLEDQVHILLLTVHHIVSDGWSIGILSDEVAAHYRALNEGTPVSLPDLTLQFADFAVWRNQRSQDAVLEPHRSYWAARLANLPRCEIPPDHPRPPIKTHNGHILSTVLPTSLTAALSGYARRQGCTLFLTILAALKVLLHHSIGQDDIYVGTLLAGRDRVELEGLIGIFINTIVLRTDLSHDPTFPELLERARHTVEEGISHQDLQFQQLVELLRPPRDPSRPVLYSINFIYQRDFVKPAEFCDLSMTPLPSRSPGAIYDLNFFMVERTDGWRLSCEYNCDLYDSSTVSRLLAQLRAIFEAIAADPNRRISQLALAARASSPALTAAAAPRIAGKAGISQVSNSMRSTERNGKV